MAANPQSAICNPQSKTCLVIQTAFLGDVILATALVEKLRHFFPEMAIDFLLRKGNESLFDGHPHLRNVLVWDKKNGKYANWLRLLWGIRRSRYDLVLNLQRFASTGFLTALSGAKWTVGFDKNPFSIFFSEQISHRIEPGVHEVARNLQLVENQTDSSFFYPKLYPSEVHFERAKRRAAGRDFFTIAPTSVWFTKQFPVEKWVELIQRLPAGQAVFLLGGPSDFVACEVIRKAARPSVENLAGQLNYLESAALMAQATLNFVNDSGPMHLASAVDAPTVAVFCSTVPAFGFGPLSSKNRVVETAENLACRPCGLHGHRACPEGHFRCATTIDVGEILAALAPAPA